MENAWDHASRIEKIPNVQVVGIAELNKTRAEEVLIKRRFKHPGNSKSQMTI